MKLLGTVLLMLCAGLTTAAQNYPVESPDLPTLEQCRGCKALWISNNNSSTSHQTFSPLGYDELRHRALVLTKCSIVVSNQHSNATYGDLAESLPYNDGAQAYGGEMLFRLHDFISRHNQQDLFRAEDAAGKR